MPDLATDYSVQSTAKEGVRDERWQIQIRGLNKTFGPQHVLRGGGSFNAIKNPKSLGSGELNTRVMAAGCGKAAITRDQRRVPQGDVARIVSGRAVHFHETDETPHSGCGQLPLTCASGDASRQIHRGDAAVHEQVRAIYEG